MEYVCAQNNSTNVNPIRGFSMVKQGTRERNARLSPTERRDSQMPHVWILFDYWARGIGQTRQVNLYNPLLQRRFINVN
jgi:hypothetical protein